MHIRTLIFQTFSENRFLFFPHLFQVKNREGCYFFKKKGRLPVARIAEAIIFDLLFIFRKET